MSSPSRALAGKESGNLTIFIVFRGPKYCQNIQDIMVLVKCIQQHSANSLLLLISKSCVVAVLHHFSSTATTLRIHMLPRTVLREVHAHFCSVIEVGRLSLTRTFGAIYKKSTVHIYHTGFMHAFSCKSIVVDQFFLELEKH